MSLIYAKTNFRSAELPRICPKVFILVGKLLINLFHFSWGRCAVSDSPHCSVIQLLNTQSYKHLGVESQLKSLLCVIWDMSLTVSKFSFYEMGIILYLLLVLS